MAKPTGRPNGRPSLYTPELAKRICDEIAEGKSLRAIAAQGGMPPVPTIIGWIHTNQEFATAVARAREQQGDAMAEDINTLSRDVVRGAVDPNAARVAMIGMTWLAKVRNPGRYGDRQQVDVSGKLTLEQILAAAMKPKGENKE